MSFYITKSSGKKELFSLKKFRRSLRRAGAHPELINYIIEEIKKIQPETTQEVHNIVTKMLHKEARPIAARYNLKQALMQFGPAGFPFEQFVAQLLQAQGYTTELNQQVNGKCIWYEVDIVAQKENHHYLIECKFHNRVGLKSDVKVALYNKARFDDIHKAWEENERNEKIKHEYHKGWVITNTKFTSVAIKYAECVGLRLIGWTYPDNNNLPAMIDRLGLHPITALTSLTKAQKRVFLKEGFVLCRDAIKYKNLLKSLGFSERKIDRLIAETKAVCKL